MLNVSDLTPVSMKVGRRGIKYDLRHKGAGQFQFGNIKDTIDQYAFNIAVAGGDVYLQCVVDGKGQIYNTKHYKNDEGGQEAHNKTGTFGRPKLRSLLDDNGLTGVDKFTLVKIPVDGATYPVYKVVALDATVVEDEEEVDMEDNEEVDMDDDLEVDDSGDDVFADI